MTRPIEAAALGKKAAAQDRLVAAWAARARKRAERGIADARAHAELALTETLRRTPDGRKTIAKVRRSRSFVAARDRLAETAADLVKLVKDAREAFYRHECRDWEGILPASWRAEAGGGPESASLARIRGAALHGARLEDDLGAPVARAARGLQAAVAVAGGRAGAGPEVLGAWAARAADAIATAARLALRDSMTLADRMAGRDLLHPDWLMDDPTLPG